MFRRFKTKVKEQGFRATIKETGGLKVFALIAIFGALALFAARPCVQTEDPLSTARMTDLEHQIEMLEAKATSLSKQQNGKLRSDIFANHGDSAGGGRPDEEPADDFVEEDPSSEQEGDSWEALKEPLEEEEEKDLSTIKRSGPRADGRVELEPINTGCYEIQDRATCCKMIDSRYTIHGPPYYGGSPCIPSAPGVKFETDRVCEPEIFASTQVEAQSCDGKGKDMPDSAHGKESEDENGPGEDENDPGDENEPDGEDENEPDGEEENESADEDDPDGEDEDETESLEDVIDRQKEEASVRRWQAEEAGTKAHDLNLMWVTDCQTVLEWSSALLLWSAFNVKQSGDFTRIATGCVSARQRTSVLDAMNTVADIFGARDRVTVHFAPKHDTDERDLTDGEIYEPYTKAFGVKHFLDNDKPRNRVGVILDPDFMFNRPLKYKINELNEKDIILPSTTRAAGDWKHDVQPGRPVGQLYGLGTGWMTDYDRETICGKGSPCTHVSESDAWKYFTMGPPIFMTIDDWIKVAQGWYDFLPIIRRTGKDWMEEMRAFTMSTAHVKQKTAIFQHYMISATSNDINEEGWPWLEQNPKLLKLDICAEGKALNTANYPEIDVDEHPYPPILHYCAAYEPEYYDFHYFWSKYQINFGLVRGLKGDKGEDQEEDNHSESGDILDCHQPLYEDPPRDLLVAQLPYPGLHAGGGRLLCLTERRQAWALCQVQYTLNDMLIAYKTQKCGQLWNKNRTAFHQFDPQPTGNEKDEEHASQCRKIRPQK